MVCDKNDNWNNELPSRVHNKEEYVLYMCYHKFLIDTLYEQFIQNTLRLRQKKLVIYTYATDLHSLCVKSITVESLNKSHILVYIIFDPQSF